MRLLPKFADDETLREQVSLIYENYINGLIAYVFVSLVITFAIYSQLGDRRILIWFAVVTFFTVSSFIRFQFFRDTSISNPAFDATIIVAFATVHGFLFAYLPITFISESSPVIFVTIALACAGLSAGSVALHSPCFPVFLGFTYASVISLTISLFSQSSPIYNSLAYSCILFLIALTWFASKMEATIRDSIQLSFENSGLIGKLRSALNQTDEANRAKSVFLASASHDLRQPLHALGLLTETLGSTNLDSQQSELQAHMLSAVDSTRTMLDSLLNISKLDAGAISPEPKPFFVQTIFSKLESELAPTADENRLIYRTRETIAAAHSDSLIVELILRNLIANAIRYTHSGGLLVACRNRHPDRFVIEVWDTGIGMPDDKIDQIFSEFQQLDNPERSAEKGFGLGLAIAQGLAKTIDSEITVHSIQEKGSVFRFELPASNAEVIEDLPYNTAQVNFNGHRALVIDDNTRVLTSMVGLLTSWGFNCLSGESAKQAINAVGSQTIDLLLVDYRLRENKTGREAIEEIRRHLNDNVPAIIITGDTAADRIKEAQSVDALLLHKPASAAQLQRMIRTLLSETPN